MGKVFYVVAKDSAESKSYNGPIHVAAEGAEPIHTAIMDLIQEKAGREDAARCQMLVQRYQSGGFAVEILDRMEQFEEQASAVTLEQTVEVLAGEPGLVYSGQPEERVLPTQSELADIIVNHVKAIIGSDSDNNPYREVPIPEEITISLMNEDGITGYTVKLSKGAHKLAKVVVEAVMEDISVADFAVVFGPKVSINTTDDENELG